MNVPAGVPPRQDGPLAGVSRGPRFLGWVFLADEPRSEARQAVSDLKSLGLRRQLLLTGDRSEVARRIGAYLEVPEVCAEALPEQKMQSVIEEVAAGHKLFNQNCAHCHGPDAVEGERRRNLRLLHHRYGDNADRAFLTTVTHGRVTKGMPNWAGILTDEQFHQILAFPHSVKEP